MDSETDKPDEYAIEVDWKDLPTIDISAFDSMNMAYYTTLPTSTLYSTTASSYGTITIGASGSSSNYNYNSWTTAGANGTSGPWVTSSSAGSGLHVKSDAEFEGDIKWKGRSLSKLLESIEDRLAILTDPDPKKLEKFAALKKAYDHYKTMERLIGDDWKDDKET